MRRLKIFFAIIFGFVSNANSQTFPLTIEAEAMAIKTVGGDAGNGFWNIWANGYIEQTVNFPSTGVCQFDVTAFGTPLQNIWPQMEIRRDDLPIGNFTVTQFPAAYSAQFACTIGQHRIAIAFLNDASVANEDRNLYVDKMVLSQVSVAPAPTSAPIPVPTPASSMILANTLNGDFYMVVMSVNPGLVDTQPPIIQKITYGATTLADGAVLGSGTSYEFRVTATDNIGIAYAMLELLTSPTDTVGKSLEILTVTNGPLSSPIRFIWNQSLKAGTYYLRATVYDPFNHGTSQVFKVIR